MAIKVSFMWWSCDDHVACMLMIMTFWWLHVHVYYVHVTIMWHTCTCGFMWWSRDIHVRCVLCLCRCPKCTNYDSALESPGVAHEKGASVLATYSNVDSETSLPLLFLLLLLLLLFLLYLILIHFIILPSFLALPPPPNLPSPSLPPFLSPSFPPSLTAFLPPSLSDVSDSSWKSLTGLFSCVVACPHTCCSQQAPNGLSPWAHQGNGCTDLIIVRRCTRLQLARWMLRQRKDESQASYAVWYKCQFSLNTSSVLPQLDLHVQWMVYCLF